MKVLYSPQLSKQKIEYEFLGEVIVATINNQSDTFDFTNQPDGEVGTITTTLPINPIISAQRKNGILSVELLDFIDSNAAKKERFPEWQEV